MDEKQLLNLKKEIDLAKTKVAELNGEKKHLMQELKDIWKCATLGEGEKLLERMKNEIDRMNKEIEEGLQKIGEEYDAIH